MANRTVLEVTRDFPGYPVVKTELPLQGVQILSLVGEIRA